MVLKNVSISNAQQNPSRTHKIANRSELIRAIFIFYHYELKTIIICS